jgi:magnesium-transporting ATPase (P-type)
MKKRVKKEEKGKENYLFSKIIFYCLIIILVLLILSGIAVVFFRWTFYEYFDILFSFISIASIILLLISVINKIYLKKINRKRLSNLNTWSIILSLLILFVCIILWQIAGRTCC